MRRPSTINATPSPSFAFCRSIRRRKGPRRSAMWDGFGLSPVMLGRNLRYLGTPRWLQREMPVHARRTSHTSRLPTRGRMRSGITTGRRTRDEVSVPPIRSKIICGMAGRSTTDRGSSGTTSATRWVQRGGQGSTGSAGRIATNSARYGGCTDMVDATLIFTSPELYATVFTFILGTT